jgi:hypothetical protein
VENFHSAEQVAVIQWISYSAKQVMQKEPIGCMQEIVQHAHEYDESIKPLVVMTPRTQQVNQFTLHHPFV